MATVQECEHAMHQLADRLAANSAAKGKAAEFDRSLSCRLTDLDVIFGARLADGTLSDIRPVESADAQVKLRMSSDDLLALVAGELNLAQAWASGRVGIDAKVFDLLKLRSMF